ncbi:RNA-directed DNA polymerase, eukaryota, reverse transcriptase zinc-binding domain protein [Tanacetum coccineum]
MGIHVDGLWNRIKSAASKLGCLVLNTPFLYLAVLGLRPDMPYVYILKSLECSHLLNQFDVIFSWYDPRSKKASWVNWNKVLTAKERGGLGVSSLYALNRGLMCKWVWRFFAHKSLLWSRVIKAIHGPEGGLITDVRRGFRSTWSLLCQEVKKLQNQGVNIFDYIRIKIGNGDNTSFWKDKWHNEGVLKDVFPRLYALERHQNVVLVAENSGEFWVKSIRQVIDANCFPVIHSATRWVKSVPLKASAISTRVFEASSIVDGGRLVRWYLRAAEGGHVHAMYEVAMCYASGRGIAQDRQQSRK